MSETGWLALAAIAGVVTALGTAAMAVAIIMTAIIARRTLSETRDDSRARTRPIVVAELRREMLSAGTILLVLKNFGVSVAREVSVSFQPEPPEDLGALPNDDSLKWIYERYAVPIKTWAPGWTIGNVIRFGHEDMSPITVTVTYERPDGTHYQDPYYLHPDHILKETEASPSKTNDPSKLEQQKVAALQALVRTVRSS